MLKSFEYKVNKFLRDYGEDLDDNYEEMWKEKIIITKRAVEKSRRESEVVQDAEKNENERNPVEQEPQDVKEEEMLVAKLPDPPSDDPNEGDIKDKEIQRKLSKLKKFNKKWLDKEDCPQDKEKVKAV